MKKESYKSNLLSGTISPLLMVFVAIILTFLVIWISARAGTAIYKDVAPRQVEAEREVYVNTPSYINGKNEILMKYISEYKQAVSTQDKNAIRDQILNEASTVDIDKLNPQVREFIKTL